MRDRQARVDAVTALSGRERGAIEELLHYIEDRVRKADPVCAKLVCMARLSLAGPAPTGSEKGGMRRALH